MSKIEHGGVTYVEDYYLTCYLNKMFCGVIDVVYVERTGIVNASKVGVDISGVFLLLKMKNGRVIQLTNSEWASINYVALGEING